MQGPKWPLFYSHIDLVWSLLIIGTGCTLGRASRTKETLPDFLEWCWVTRHRRVFYELTGCQRSPRFWGVTTGALKEPRNAISWVSRSCPAALFVQSL